MAYFKKLYDKKNGVWYPKSVTQGKPVETEVIADRLAAISTVSRADVAAVLAELPGVMADYLAQGKSVRLEGFGTFRYTLDTKGVEREEDFDFQRQVKAVRVQFTPTKRGNAKKGEAITRALVPQGVEWLEWQGKDSDASVDDTPDDTEDDETQGGSQTGPTTPGGSGDSGEE